MNGTARVVTDNLEAGRFELADDGHVAYLSYRLRSGRLVLLHTEVPDPIGGRGIGGLLVSAAVQRAGRDGLTVVPLCPFAREWLRRHPGQGAPAPVDWGKEPASGEEPWIP